MTIVEYLAKIRPSHPASYPDLRRVGPWKESTELFEELMDCLRKAPLDDCIQVLTDPFANQAFIEPEEYDDLIEILRKKASKKDKTKLLELYRILIQRPPYHQRMYNEHLVIPLEGILKRLGVSESDIETLRRQVRAPQTPYVEAKYPTMVAEAIPAGAPGLGKHGRRFTTKVKQKKG
ncbi:MAG: hypothetical protein ACE5JQ_00545 [Candidatus Methylomirabilales bacterium]